MVPHSMLEEDLIDRERQEEENQLLRDVSYILYTHTHTQQLLITKGGGECIILVIIVERYVAFFSKTVHPRKGCGLNWQMW